jgi:hypothetical protein
VAQVLLRDLDRQACGDGVAGAAVERSRDDGVQLVRVKLAAPGRDMAAELQPAADLRRMGHVAQPLDDALRPARAHRLDAGAPIFTLDGDPVRDLWVLGDIHGLIG